ncbi:hypothetical protein CMI47_16535 [Candidatus Pacearchaeota archaeon]|nr:hypothetical protein [Candidatus Pacearchaeota archaeon]
MERCKKIVNSTIKRNWRNWNDKSNSSQQDGKSNHNTNGSGSDGDGGGVKTSPISINMDLRNKKSYSPYKTNNKVNTGGVKGKYDFKKYLKFVDMGMNTSIGNNSFNISDTGSYLKYNSWSNSSRRIYKINKRTVNKCFDIDLKILHKRRLSNSLAVMVSKIAEDRAGEPTIGDDYWSIPELLNRVVSKQQLSSCKETREKERIIVILDTSPSCAEEAIFYMDIAKASCSLNDLEMYDAPNGYIVKAYNKKNNKFDTLPRNIFTVFSKWQMFKNRTIIFFGDYDGSNILIDSAKLNSVYWLNPMYNIIRDDSHHDKISDKFVKRGGKIFKCSNEKDFMNVVRKMR